MPNVVFETGRKDGKTISETRAGAPCFCHCHAKECLENVTLGGPGGSLEGEHSLKGRSCSGKRYSGRTGRVIGGRTQPERKKLLWEVVSILPLTRSPC